MKNDPLRVKSTLPSPKLRRLPISAIVPPTATASVSAEEIRNLAESVRRHGLLQPIGVRKRPGFPVRYELLFGYRRFLACRALFLPSVPCLVFPDCREAALLSLCENFQRRETAPSELSRAAARLSLSLSALCARLPLPCPEEEKTAPPRDISLFLEDDVPREEIPSAPLRRGIVRDARLVANSIERAVQSGRAAGVRVEVQKLCHESELCYYIRFPLSGEEAHLPICEEFTHSA